MPTNTQSLSSHNTEHSIELLAGTECSLGESLRWEIDSWEREKKRKCLGKEKNSMVRATML